MKNHDLEYFMVFARQLLPFLTIMFMPIYLDGIGLSGTQIGFLMALMIVSSFLFTLPIGLYNDRVASRMLIAISVFLTALYYFSLSIFDSFIILAAIFIISGLSYSLFEISIKSLFYKTIEAKGKGLKLGLFNLFDALGISVGYLTGGVLLSIFGFRSVFIICAALSLLLIIPSFRLPKAVTAKISLLEYQKDMKRKDVIMFMVLFFLYTIHWGPERVNMSLFIRDSIGLGLMQMGIFFGVAILALSVGAFYFGKRYDQGMSLRKIITIGLLCNAIGSIGWYFTVDPQAAFIIRLIHEFGDGAFAVFISIETTNLFGKKRMGGNSSLIVFIGGIGQTIGAIAAGILAELFNNLLPILFSGMISLLALLMVPFMNFSCQKPKTI